ncbi:MAG: response regulator [Leptospiraceae bacterium]|nr:response regulator [Leptospiraceae bacterium]MDW8305673.1 response regulator [Leptospiraceae bacterium]
MTVAGPAKILIVDDSGYMRQVIRKHLENKGYEIVGEAQDGLEAIQKYVELKPDIVTMDISMKKVGGIEATKKIKAIDPKAKIIIVSALGESRFIKEAIQAGAHDFIIKPFAEERLISSISNALK